MSHPGSVAVWNHPAHAGHAAPLVATGWGAYHRTVTTGCVHTPSQTTILTPATLAASTRHWSWPDGIVIVLYSVVTPTQHAPTWAEHCTDGKWIERREEWEKCITSKARQLQGISVTQ